MSETIRHADSVAAVLASVTAVAAARAMPHVGTGEKETADQAAVDAMRNLLMKSAVDATIVIGEGEKDEAPMLGAGERLGIGGPELDIAVDPVEGTSLLAADRDGAMAIIGAAPRGAMFDPGPAFYMDKLIVGPNSAGSVSLDAPMEDTVRAIAKSEGIKPDDVCVAMLYRPRNADRLAGLRRVGAKTVLLDHGDVGPSLLAALENSSIHAVAGIGGTPEGIAIACALRGMGAEIQGRLAPQLPEEAHAVLDFFDDPGALLSSEDLVAPGPAWFAAAGITGGGPFARVEAVEGGYKTHVLVVTHNESSGAEWLDIVVDPLGELTVP